MFKQAQSISADTEAAWPMGYKTMLSRLGMKDRQSFERQVAAQKSKTDSGLAKKWCRLARVMMSLTETTTKVSGQQAKLCGIRTMQFFIPDGKYRQQVFAMHVRDDGTLAVCVPDVLDDAIREGALAHAGNEQYRLPESGKLLAIHSLDRNTPNPEEFYKGMTGWYRKAICIDLPASACTAQIGAVERLCVLAASKWATLTVPEQV